MSHRHLYDPARILRDAAEFLSVNHRTAELSEGRLRPTSVVQVIAHIRTGRNDWPDLATIQKDYAWGGTLAATMDALSRYLGVSGRLTVQYGEAVNQIVYWSQDPDVTTREIVDAMRAAAAYYTSTQQMLVGGAW